MRAPNYNYRALTLTQAQTARMLYREGWGTKQLAQHFVTSPATILRALKRGGVHIRERGEQARRLHSWSSGRDDNGVNVTLRCQRDGSLFSMHVPGKRLEAIQHVADTIDAAADVWKVLSYSTPETIAADLEGAGMRSPEGQALIRIGRLDLLDPEVRR